MSGIGRRGKVTRAIIRLIVAAALLPLQAWYLMLAAGITHRDWWPQVPVIGYGDAVVLTFLLSAAVGSMVSSATDRSSS